MVLYIESSIYAFIAAGMIGQRRWGLILAIVFLLQVIASHIAFALTFVSDPIQTMSVRAAAMQGPSIVMITLYLWIRANDLNLVRTPKFSRAISPESSDVPEAVAALSRV